MTVSFHAFLLKSRIFFFVFLVETGFHHLGQDGLELLASSDLPASASRGAEITGMSLNTRLSFHNLKIIFK